MKVLVDISEDILTRMKLVSKVSSVDGVCQAVLDGTILDNLSNGEVIKAVFPKADIEDYKDGVMTVCFDFDKNEVVEFWNEKQDDWWNSPYKESEKEVCKDCYYNDGEVHAECIVCDKTEREVE